MFDGDQIGRLISVIREHDGIGDKAALAEIVKRVFCLTGKGKAMSNASFSIRFSEAKGRRMNNTVMSLAALLKLDEKPFFVCIVAPDRNYLLLANTTFLKRVSHSSQNLRVDNIRGSFNGSDIMLTYQDMENSPENFQRLFEYHERTPRGENLERLVESTGTIVGRAKSRQFTPEERDRILSSVDRARDFLRSDRYKQLKSELDARARSVRDEIALAARVDNVNVRGRAIEYLVTAGDTGTKRDLIDALRNGTPLPRFKTEDALGDYSGDFGEFHTETDIKSKIMSRASNPKAYNIDKLLGFLAEDRAVYLIYLLGVDENGQAVTRLCSVFDERLIRITKYTASWSGRGSRGTAQFAGSGLAGILRDPDLMRDTISEKAARDFLVGLMDR